jgi:murein L,D-transpeptidase YcbB/YkuD
MTGRPLARGDRRCRGETPDELADLDLLLSAALLAATADSGDSPPAALLAGARKGDPRAFVATHLPGTFFYWGLLKALPAYRQYAAGPAWPTVPSGPKLEKGTTDPRVAALGHPATAELAAAPAEADSKSQVFDDTLAAALRKFQSSHGLDADGKVGPQTVAALNVSAADRLNSILLNMERFRQLSSSMGARYLYVNIAGMELFLVEQGKVTHNRVIVGRIDRKTPHCKADVSHRLQPDLGRAGEDRADRRTEPPPQTRLFDPTTSGLRRLVGRCP